MLRKLLATIILVVSLEAQIEKFQVIANSVDSKNNIMIATGNVVIFSPTYYITAQKIIYDKNKGTFELFDDVLILKDNNVQTKSEYAFLDVNSDDLYQKPNMLFDESESIWINSKDSEKKDDLITLASSIFSSCDCVDPDWSIRMSSADYNIEKKWINSYNTRLYVKDIPVLYFPYLGFSTDTERKTGLLIPTFGYSSSEGGFYTQPIFIAPAANYDIELIPQFKAKRGTGMYAYVRYADSIDSILRVSGGYFEEKKEYQEENDLRNKRHYGLEVNYERYNLFTGKRKEHKDGLFVDINYLNDIEHQTLQDVDDTESEVESKINYIYNTPDYLLGAYLRYYIDTDEESNDETLQELPKLQAHSYLRPLFFDKLLYSTDFKYTNYSRSEGITANQYEVNIPLSYSYTLFDDYLNFTVKQTFSLNKYEYSNFSTTEYKDGTYAESNTTFSLSSDLIKPYENYLHTINLSADYTKSDTIKEDGNIYGIDDYEPDALSEFSVTQSSDSITLGVNQSFYDRDNLKEIVKHKISQSILYDEFDDAKLQNMENEITYNYILGSVKNSLIYNHQDEKLTESSSSFSLTYDNFAMKLGHYMSKDTPNSGKEDLESYQIDLKYKFSDEYSIGYYTNYNLEEKLRSKQSFIFSITDKCWNLDLRYEQEVTASSTIDGDPQKQDIVYLELLLKPLGGINQEYEIERD